MNISTRERLIGASVGFLALGGASNFIRSAIWTFEGGMSYLKYIVLAGAVSIAFLYAAWSLLFDGLKRAYIALVLLIVFGTVDASRLILSVRRHMEYKSASIPYLTSSIIIHFALFGSLLWLYSTKNSKIA